MSMSLSSSMRSAGVSFLGGCFAGDNPSSDLSSPDIVKKNVRLMSTEEAQFRTHDILR